jgi:HK97 family phage major capsid protein
VGIAELRTRAKETRERVAEAKRKNEEIVASLRKLDGDAGDEMNEEQQKEWDRLDDEQRKASSEVEAAEKAEGEARAELEAAEVAQDREERSQRVKDSRKKWRSLQLGNASGTDRFTRAREMVSRGVHQDWDGRNVVGELLRMIDGRVDEVAERDEKHIEKVLRRHLTRQSDAPEWNQAATRGWGHQLLMRSLPEYTSAFNKVMRSGPMAAVTLSPEERAAIAVGTSTSGGFLVPLYLDPTIMLSSDGSANVVRQIARIVTLDPGQGNTWKGIVSPGMTASTDAEYAEVSDDSPSFTEPEVPLFTNRTFAKATYQAVEDIPDLAGELLMMFADSRDVLEGDKHCNGAGTTEATGIVTALDANTNVEVTSTTAATIGVVDINGLLRAVPQRFRRNAQWLMNDVWADGIFALGTAVGSSYTGTLAEALSPTLKGKPWHTSDDMPATVTTTVADNEIVVGDWSKFVIVDRPAGMAVEFIQNLTSQTTGGMPTGERGWVCWWRNGSDSVLDVAFRMLQDKTSA